MATLTHLRCFRDMAAMPFDRCLVRWRVMVLDYHRNAKHGETTSDCRSAMLLVTRDDGEKEREMEIDTAHRRTARCGQVDAATPTFHHPAASLGRYRTAE
jgi:hypothetical protein